MVASPTKDGSDRLDQALARGGERPADTGAGVLAHDHLLDEVFLLERSQGVTQDLELNALDLHPDLELPAGPVLERPDDPDHPLAAHDGQRPLVRDHPQQGVHLAGLRARAG